MIELTDEERAVYKANRLQRWTTLTVVWLVGALIANLLATSYSAWTIGKELGECRASHAEAP